MQTTGRWSVMRAVEKSPIRERREKIVVLVIVHACSGDRVGNDILKCRYRYALRQRMLTLVEEMDAQLILVPSSSPPGARQASASRRTRSFLSPSHPGRAVYLRDFSPSWVYMRDTHVVLLDWKSRNIPKRFGELQVHDVMDLSQQYTARLHVRCQLYASWYWLSSVLQRLLVRLHF